MSAVSTHVLDTARGCPASDIAVRLTDADGRQLAAGRTDEDGRMGDLGPDDMKPGRYRLVFDTGPYFTGTGQPAFFPDVTISFTITDPAEHYHVPLLLSPFAYSTYRGS